MHFCPRTHRHHILSVLSEVLFCLAALLNSQPLPDALARNGHRWSVVQLTDQNTLLKSPLKLYLSCMQQMRIFEHGQEGI